MSDTGPTGKWIDVLDMQRWAKALGCTELEVNAAIRRVGNSAAAVRSDLAKHAGKQKTKARVPGSTLLAEDRANIEPEKIRVHMLGF
jgi:hypothetical protein